MADIQARLTVALADRYRIERELGQGGMATVYLAEDLKHHRRVAIKVLRPELAAAMGPERFTREIDVAARLQHPHILGLLDSGDSDGLFYYVMPYVEGETLRDRLTRGGELPVHDAVRLLIEIAEALDVAHKAGVAHRDIKPENVLLTGRHALVMDFGVAKAVSEASGRQQLTTAGVALGTPAYMAPEQAAADPHMDGRVDIYALGALAYEMLTGHPPFHGLSPQQTLAAHVSQTPTPVGQQRVGLSPVLESVVMKCLAKRPADRYQTADELVRVLEAESTPSGGMTPTQTRPAQAIPAARRWKPWALGAAAATVSAVALLVWRPWAHAAGPGYDAHLVAVMPFRVVGADPSVHYLRQGMLDLLQAKLTGEGGPRAADARSVLAAVRDAGGSDTEDLPQTALAGVARRIGAGEVLQGSIVGPPEHLVISANLLRMPDGSLITQTTVEGPRDSLFTLVDRLTAQLLALGAGANTSQLSGLTTTSLDALRAYLEGVTAYRRGAFGEATPLLERAVQLDSTFALALSALVEASGWGQPPSMDMDRVRRLAWRSRDRLNEVDQLLLSIRLGSRYPRYTPWNERIADRERLTDRMRESAEAWYYLGDALFHFGAISDIPNAQTRAREAFEEAYRRDSLYALPVEHLQELAFVAGDTASLRHWARRRVAMDTSSTVAWWMGWKLAVATRDEREISRLIREAKTWPRGTMIGVIATLSLDSVVQAHQAELLESGQGSNGEVALRIVTLWNAGRPAEAARWVDTLRRENPEWAANLAVFGALFAGGERPDSQSLKRQRGDMWRASLGDVAAGDRFLADERRRAQEDSSGSRDPLLATLQAWLAGLRGAGGVDQLSDRVDSLLKGWGTLNGAEVTTTSLMLARLFQQQGRVDRALLAVRRRVVNGAQPDFFALAESFRLEGLLAAQAGDKAGAIRAYRDYLKLRHDPEPSRIPQRDSVRAELARLGDLEGSR